MSGSQIEPPWRLALALKGSRHCAPHSYYRLLSSAGRSSQQPAGLVTRWLLPAMGTGLEDRKARWHGARTACAVAIGH
jgi:hypothetical protein